jgi:hypothetical protein
MSTTTEHVQTDCYDRGSRFLYPQSNWRQTIWPSTDAEGNVFTLGNPLRVNSFREQNKRWTGAFDPEARASRMSMLADHSLLPPPLQPHSQHEQWAGGNARLRRTWLHSTVEETNIPERAWSDEFDVEKRSSWVSLGSEQYEEDSGSLDDGKDVFEVGWEDEDVENPLNFGRGKKWLNAMVLALAVFMVSIASSGFSQGKFN